MGFNGGAVQGGGVLRSEPQISLGKRLRKTETCDDLECDVCVPFMGGVKTKRGCGKPTSTSVRLSAMAMPSASRSTRRMCASSKLNLATVGGVRHLGRDGETLIFWGVFLARLNQIVDIWQKRRVRHLGRVRRMVLLHRSAACAVVQLLGK